MVQFRRHRLFNLIKPKVVQSEPILNMSAGGLAFRYSGRAMRAVEGCELSIRVADDREKIEPLEFKVISDNPIQGEDAVKALPMRRCGIKFDNVAPGLGSQIDRFIEKYAHHNFGASPSKELRNGWYSIDLSP